MRSISSGPQTIRVPFPATKATIGLNFTNSGTEPPDSYYANVQVSIGQVSGIHADIAELDSVVADSGANYDNFAPRQACSVIPFNATERVGILSGSAIQAGQSIPRDIVGMNATIEADISLSSKMGGSLEDVFQCGYVTFVSDEDFKNLKKGECGLEDLMKPAITTSSTTAMGTGTSSATTASSTTTVVPSSGLVHGGSANGLSGAEIGAVTGCSIVGFTILLATLLFCLFRRRRATKRRAQKQSSDPATAATGSELEEQLPTYVEATEKTSNATIEKGGKAEKTQMEADEISFHQSNEVNTGESSEEKK
ncbi:MAG: hypothetical protein Q9227_002890 [Pyrenula ochraceoflavens]